MMRAVQFVEKRVKPHVAFRAVAMFAGVNDVVNALNFVARLHRAFGDNLGVLVKNQLLDCMDFPIGHGENSF